MSPPHYVNPSPSKTNRRSLYEKPTFKLELPTVSNSSDIRFRVVLCWQHGNKLREPIRFAHGIRLHYLFDNFCLSESTTKRVGSIRSIKYYSGTFRWSKSLSRSASSSTTGPRSIWTIVNSRGGLIDVALNQLKREHRPAVDQSASNYFAREIILHRSFLRSLEV